jgi:DNA polymerase I
MAKFGVPPERIVDYLTLIGDAVDNVPGVDKVGPKTAAKWIAEHGSLDGVMAAAAGIKGVAGENLRKALDWLPTGRKLVTVVTDCDLAGHVPGWPALEALALRGGPRGAAGLLPALRLPHLARELEARSGRGAARPRCPPAGGAAPAWQRRRPAARAAAPPLAREYETVTSWERLDAWLQRLRRPLVALDTETDSLDAMRARIVGISFAVEPGRAAYVPLAPRLPRRARAAAAGRGAGAAEALAGGRRRAPSWARTSSTTCTCSPTTASPCAATARHHAAELRARGAQAARPGKRWPSATSAARA